MYKNGKNYTLIVISVLFLILFNFSVYKFNEIDKYRTEVTYGTCVRYHEYDDYDSTRETWETYYETKYEYIVNGVTYTTTINHSAKPCLGDTIKLRYEPSKPQLTSTGEYIGWIGHAICSAPFLLFILIGVLGIVHNNKERNKEVNVMDLNVLRSLSETTDTMTEEMFETLTEFINYNSTGMRVTVTEVLTTLKTRIEGGETIKFYATEEPMSLDEFKETVLEAFGEQIFEDVFDTEIQ